MILQTFLFTLLFFPQTALASTTPVISPKTAPETPKSIYMYKLAMCESGGNWNALNPKDLDGTPSKGKYQFKDSTFNWLSGKYKIATTSIWNGNEQDLIVSRMIDDPSINMKMQFPDCVRKLGLPPTSVQP
jgi:hypothetical protein